MGSRFSVSKTTAAISTGADAFTFVAPANRSLKIWALRMYGSGTLSAYNEMILSRSTGGVTPSAPIVPTPLSPDSAAATFTVPTVWVTQPTIGAVVERVGVNSNGAAVQLVFPPGQEIDVPAGTQVSLRAASGSGTLSFSAVVEQV